MKMVPLADIADLHFGGAFKSAKFNSVSDGLPLARIRDVKPGYSTTYFNGEYDKKYLINSGDFLIGMDGEFNVGVWRGGKALLNQRVCKVGKTRADLDARYLARFLPLKLKEIEEQTPYATVKHLSAKVLRAIEVPLPPLDEQRRIAAILDKADAIRQKRRQAIARLDTLTQSIFHDMFASSQSMTSLQSICLKITDGTHQSPQWESAGVPFLFVSNITSGEIDFRTKKYISLATWRELTKNAPIQNGDVLFSTVGSFGATAVVRTDAPFAFQRHIAHIKPNRELVNPDFLSAQLSSTKLYRQATRAARGIAQPTVNLGDIRNFQVVCPEMELQSTFASIASRIREKKLKLRNSLANLDDLHSSLQSRAFRGEL